MNKIGKNNYKTTEDLKCSIIWFCLAFFIFLFNIIMQILCGKQKIIIGCYVFFSAIYFIAAFGGMIELGKRNDKTITKCKIFNLKQKTDDMLLLISSICASTSLLIMVSFGTIGSRLDNNVFLMIYFFIFIFLFVCFGVAEYEYKKRKKDNCK